MQVKKQQLELDVEQQAGSKSGKEYIKAVYCHPVYLTYKQSTSCKMPGWMKQKWESRLPENLDIEKLILILRNINNLRYADDNTLIAESEEELKSLLMKVKEESKKTWLKTQHSENEDHGIWSHYFMANQGENSGNSG